MHTLQSFFLAVSLFFSSLFGGSQPAVAPTPISEVTEVAVVTHADDHAHTDDHDHPDQEAISQPAPVATSSVPAHVAATTTVSKQVTSTTDSTDGALLLLADNKYKDGTVLLGDNHYTTTAPKKGYVYLCNINKGNPGSAVNGTWIHGSSWNFLEKLTIAGSVAWPQAFFTNVISGVSRILTGNDLPTDHTTGTFPVAASDPAAAFDKNPNTISAQSMTQTLPKDPTYLETPSCMGGEVGVMLNGVALFNAFDAGLRDAPAHELQDHCDGHPQGDGQYHYHSLSSCFKDTSVSTVLGYALDGFPITGNKVATDKYLQTEDLDVCHGITSDVLVDGKKKTTYHYVMTQDFPYSVSCFRGKPSSLQIGKQGGQGGKPTSQQQAPSQVPTTPQNGQAGVPGRTPPQQAIDACTNKTSGVNCTMQTPNGTMSGTCGTPPGITSLACMPNQ